ncbi:MAG TPA: SRPBCC family protein [Candidatus Binatia bacterium]|nr:SRPBCC family protein [Candidatus Binatia bacterium]
MPFPFARLAAGLGVAAVAAPWLYRRVRRTILSHDRGNRGIKVDAAVTVNETPERLYRFWRQVENLPHVMSHLKSVTAQGPRRSRWTVTLPAGTTLAWDAEIINDIPNTLIAWQAVQGSPVDHAGSVHFDPTAAGGTVVRVSLQYDPPAGELGHALAALFGEDARSKIEEDLRTFKQSMERGARADTVSW